MRAKLQGIESEPQARRALEEIERLVREAGTAGLRLDPWLAELAEELRAVLPEVDAAGAARIAARVAADPRVSLAAQGRIRAETLRALRG
ncbi:MAG TPA: hypothetical protein VGB54_09095 [Allosphingosinicella sp.]|jgi:predicted TIM-barrel fold metal-dependent hydrolase